ncbi:MAG: chromosomal replication initiator protein DnaA [Anaeroplasmataceae bacterium]
MQKYQNIWNLILEELYKNYEHETIDEIFSDTKKVINEENGLVYILVPSLFVQNKINNIYMPSINKLAAKVTNEPIRFKFITEEEFIRKQPHEDPVKKQIEYDSGLNSSYTFDSFVIGDSNRFSARNAMLVAEQPGTVSNPLYIFGGVGLGKTHLMQAIGNYILDKDLNKKVLYIKSQNYMAEFTKAAQNKNMEQFEAKYENLDVLLIDDIQMLSKGTKTQEQFFNLFNNMYDMHKQIVITADCSPLELNNFMDRLRTRFSWGLQVDITPPTLELRVKILKRKLFEQSSNKEITDDVFEYIASLYSNIRDLEGGLRRVLSYSVVWNKDITLDLVKEALEAIIKSKPENGSEDVYENLKSIVADFYHISVEDLISKKRTSNLVTPRHICMYLLKSKYNLPYKKIGTILGGKDHSTVMSGCAKIEQEIETNKDTKLAVETLVKKLNI